MFSSDPSEYVFSTLGNTLSMKRTKMFCEIWNGWQNVHLEQGWPGTILKKHSEQTIKNSSRIINFLCSIPSALRAFRAVKIRALRARAQLFPSTYRAERKPSEIFYEHFEHERSSSGQIFERAKQIFERAVLVPNTNLKLEPNFEKLFFKSCYFFGIPLELTITGLRCTMLNVFWALELGPFSMLFVSWVKFWIGVLFDLKWYSTHQFLSFKNEIAIPPMITIKKLVPSGT